MKHSYFLTLALAFTFMGVFLSFNEKVVKDEQALEKISKQEVALYIDRKTRPETAVLGAEVEQVNSFIMPVDRQSPVLDILRDDKIVIVEHTEDGDIVRAIGTVGLADIDREASKQWSFTVNGKNYDRGSDRVIVVPGDVVAWYYQ
jgi:uncharacterized protein YjiK